MPALLTSRSTLPTAASPSATAARMEDSWAMSTGTGVIVQPCAPKSARMASSASWSRSNASTRAPRAAAVSAVARPMPLPAPVTATVLPRK
ncbi:hypothetical protein D9M69_711720 [compost metagenome]